MLISANLIREVHKVSPYTTEREKKSWKLPDRIWSGASSFRSDKISICFTQSTCALSSHELISISTFLHLQKIPPNNEKETMEANDQSKQQQLNEDDNRFEIPTDQSIQSKNVNEVIYSDGGIPSNNPNNTELFTTQSNDLDTRLKWAWSSQNNQITRELHIYIWINFWSSLYLLFLVPPSQIAFEMP